MKKRQITFWKNTGHESLRGKTVELFKVSWDENNGGWKRDENGPYWGMYKIGTQEVRRLNRDPNSLGDVTYVEENGVVHLEAEDVSVTPEAGDLGEEEE
jgi:hypothetical protein